MANIISSKGYDSSYRGSNAPGAFYAVYTSDFGEPAPAAPSLSYNATSGSLATGTGHVQVTWITTEGPTLASSAAVIESSSASGQIVVAQPTVPTNGATVIGWQVFSQGSSGVLLNTAGTSPAPQSIAVNGGNVTGFLITTTLVDINTYGTGAAVPAFDQSGIQPPLPLVPAANGAASGADYDFIVPNSGSLWKVYKPVQFARPDGTAETPGVGIAANLDCIQPLYPGATPGVATYTRTGVGNGTFMVMNGILFEAVQLSTGTTAATFIGGAAFAGVAKGSTVADGTVTWLSFGKASLVRAHFLNSSSNTAAYPVAQEYDLFEL